MPLKAFIFFLVLCSCEIFSQVMLKSPEIGAQEFINLMSRSKFDEAHSFFSGEVKNMISPAQLGEVWKQYTGTLGSYKGFTPKSGKASGGNYIVESVLEFSKEKLVLKLTFGRNNDLLGMFFSQYADEIPLPPNTMETEVKIGAPYPLGGKLLRPLGKEKAPVIIMLSGSGPNDMDATIGPNKIFKELSYRLAEKGIATLRFDKRTFTYPEKFADGTFPYDLESEYLSDIRYILQNKTLLLGEDHGDIYVLGHSLGGFLMPAISMIDDEVKGYIIASGNFDGIEKLLLPQFEHIYSHTDMAEDDKRIQISALRERLRNLEQSLSSNLDTLELPLNIPMSYWRSQSENSPLMFRNKIGKDKNFLVLQGSRDYQVTPDQADKWKEYFRETEGAKVVILEGLDHIFHYGTDVSKPDDYSKADTISPLITEEISKWIFKN